MRRLVPDNTSHGWTAADRRAARTLRRYGGLLVFSALAYAYLIELAPSYPWLARVGVLVWLGVVIRSLVRWRRSDLGL